MTTFAFIGFGEAGTLIARGLKQAGATVPATYDILVSDPAKRDRFLAHAAAEGVRAAESAAEAVAGADVVLAAVVCSQTMAAAESVAPHLTPGQFYLDINSTSPMVKQRAAEVIGATGARYVESAVMDLVPPHGHKVPMLLAGERAAELAPVLNGYGMDTSAIGTAIGQASSIKMVRSVFLKGFSAILLECLVAAHRVNGQDYVLDSLQTTFPQIDWRAMADYYAARLVRHARRQSEEMEDVCDTLEFLGLEPITARATSERLAWLADLGLDADGTPPRTFAELSAAVESRRS